MPLDPAEEEIMHGFLASLYFALALSGLVYSGSNAWAAMILCSPSFAQLGAFSSGLNLSEEPRSPVTRQTTLPFGRLPGSSDKTNPTRLVAQHSEEGGPICGWIGVEVRPMTRPFADSLGMTELYGAIFDRPQPDGPAAQAKIQAGDVLTAINGSALVSSSDFIPTISAMAPGTDVDLTTYRDGQLIEVKVTLGSYACPPH
jgi:hypothetical protein